MFCDPLEACYDGITWVIPYLLSLVDRLMFNPQSAACFLLQLSSFSAASTSPVAGAGEETAKSSSSGDIFLY